MVNLDIQHEATQEPNSVLGVKYQCDPTMDELEKMKT